MKYNETWRERNGKLNVKWNGKWNLNENEKETKKLLPIDHE